jgi:hypothetical protein
MFENLNKKQYIYIIECENIKFYIDSYYSDKILLEPEEAIIKQNIIKFENVLKYKPIKICRFSLETYENVNSTIKLYMRQHGINNVRGGDYSELELSEKIINKLNFEFLGKNNNSNSNIKYCFHCMKEHNNNDCLGKNIDTSIFLKDCNDYNTIIIKINYISNYYDKIVLLNNQINEITYCINADNYNSKLDEKYKKYIMNNNDPDNLSSLKDYNLMKYELDSLLFDKKLELVNIYKVHKSEFYLKDILEELYKRKLKHMYDSIE